MTDTLDVTDTIHVEVAFALPDKQSIIPLSVPQGTSMYDAVTLSGICEKYPEIDLDNSSMGIFGKAENNPKTVILKEGDRVEIYRPLIADPKEVRKKRAEAAKQEKGQA